MAGSKEDYINYRIAKSEEVFEDAKLLVREKRWNSCVNRLYYSSFYLVSALLFKHNIKADTHNGIRTQFFQEFVKKEIISKEQGKLYSNLFTWRQETDYADFIDFDETIVNPLISSVSKFNDLIKGLIFK